MSALEQLRTRIAIEGSINVADYIEICNTHYYATRDPLGAAGDFTTAPEISQIFGELLGAWLAEQWLNIGSPQAVLCEPGGGRGTLMHDLLRATRHVPQFHERITLYMVETSPVLRKRQQETLKQAHPTIQWHDDFEALPSLPLLLVANEFFDALPVQQFLQNGAERKIALTQDALHWCDETAVAEEKSPASIIVMQKIAAHMKRYGGAAIIADYGYEHSALAQATNRDTLQALRQHKTVSVLEHPGEADLTAHVDFSALAGVASKAGLAAHITTQGDFLRRAGAELRAATLCKQASQATQEAILSGLERLVSPQHMGTLFKVMTLIQTP